MSKSERVLQMLDARVLALRKISGSELFVAKLTESPVIANFIGHSTIDTCSFPQRLFKIDRFSNLFCGIGLVTKKHAQKGAVNLERSIVIDKTELSELVHEEADARASGPDHFSEGLLADFRRNRFRKAFLAKIR